jgi:hypothetical protein
MTGPATAMVTPLAVRQAASVCSRALQPVAATVRRRDRLEGLIHEYYQAAAWPSGY